MPNTVLIDLVTEDPVNQEFVLYLVERGPWVPSDLPDRLRLIQTRIYDAIDVVLTGQLANKYPESKGWKVRIQIDAFDDPPEDVDKLESKFVDLLRTDPIYANDILTSEFISGLRIVTRSQMGRS